MTHEAIMEKLNEIFQDIFDDDTLVITENTTANDIEDWDSLEHINLVSAVEKAFGMKFRMQEVSGMKNVGEMADIIAARAEEMCRNSWTFQAFCCIMMIDLYTIRIHSEESRCQKNSFYLIKKKIITRHSRRYWTLSGRF